MTASIVGVDIGSESLRAVELIDVDSEKPTAVHFHEVPLAHGSVRRGEVVDVKVVATALKALWSAGKFGTKNVVLGMGGPRVLSRDFTVPKTSLALIREALPFTAQSVLPVPVKTALLDFYPISESVGETGPVVHGLLVAAVKEAVELNVAAVERAGLRPVRVDLIPFALARALAPIGRTLGLVAILSIGANTTNVVVTLNGVPQFLRIISAGGDNITRSIAERLSLGLVEAEQLKRSLGLTPPPGLSERDEAAAEIIRTTAGELFDEIRDTLNYYVVSHPGTALGEIIITGGGQHLSGLTEALSQITARRVVDAQLTDKFGVAQGLYLPADPTKRGNWTTAIGLALGGTP